MAIDLGKLKSAARLHCSEDEVTCLWIKTRPHAIHALLEAWPPERLVIEVGRVSGWGRERSGARRRLQPLGTWREHLPDARATAGARRDAT